MFAKEWNTECNYSEKTVIKLNESTFSAALVGLDEISNTNKRVIVDNTPLPKGGAYTESTLSAQLSVRTDFEMSYNIRTLTIYCGLASIFFLFINLGLIYLYCKLRADTESKRTKLLRDSDGQYGNIDNDEEVEDKDE